MWFVFGFITLISVAALSAYLRIHAGWKGKPGRVGDLPYQYKVLRSKYGITGFLLGAAGAPGYDFTFKRESSVDRFFKSIGVSSEYQVGNREFDQLVYVVSDNAQLHRQISSRPAIVDAVVRIFAAVESHGCRVREIRNSSGRLWVRMKTARKQFKEAELSGIAEEVVPLLGTIGGELERAPLAPSSRWRDPFVLKAALILALSTGLAINGAVQLVRLIWTTVPFTLDGRALLVGSLWWGGGIVAALVVVSLLLLGRSARAHLVLIELLVVGSLGAVSSAFMEMRDLNMELDRAPAVEYRVMTHYTQASRSGRSTSYYVYVDDWTRESPVRRVEVSSGFYHRVNKGDELVVRQRPGYLGYRWVESVEKSE